MVKRIRFAVVAALGVATLVAGPVTAASAGTAKVDPAVTDVSVSPSPVEVRGAETVKVTFTAETAGGASAVTGWIKPAVGVETEFALAKSDDLGSGKARWKSTKDVDRRFAPGTWTFRASAAGTAPKYAEFTVKQVFETDFDDIAATPAVVDRGEPVTLGGVLRRNGANGWAPWPAPGSTWPSGRWAAPTSGCPAASRPTARAGSRSRPGRSRPVIGGPSTTVRRPPWAPGARPTGWTSGT